MCYGWTSAHNDFNAYVCIYVCLYVCTVSMLYYTIFFDLKVPTMIHYQYYLISFNTDPTNVCMYTFN